MSTEIAYFINSSKHVTFHSARTIRREGEGLVEVAGVIEFAFSFKIADFIGQFCVIELCAHRFWRC